MFTRIATILAGIGVLSLYAVLVLVDPAPAADATTTVVSTAAAPVASNGVVIPWGSWVTAILSWVLSIVLTLAANVIRTRVKDAGSQEQLDALLKNGVDYGFGVVAGAIKGRSLTLPQANSVITAVEQYVANNGPAIATKYADTLRQKIIARVGATGSLPPDAHGAQLGVNVV